MVTSCPRTLLSRLGTFRSVVNLVVGAAELDKERKGQGCAASPWGGYNLWRSLNRVPGVPLAVSDLLTGLA